MPHCCHALTSIHSTFVIPFVLFDVIIGPIYCGVRRHFFFGFDKYFADIQAIRVRPNKLFKTVYIHFAP